MTVRGWIIVPLVTTTTNQLTTTENHVFFFFSLFPRFSGLAGLCIICLFPRDRLGTETVPTYYWDDGSAVQE